MKSKIPIHAAMTKIDAQLSKAIKIEKKRKEAVEQSLFFDGRNLGSINPSLDDLYGEHGEKLEDIVEPNVFVANFNRIVLSWSEESEDLLKNIFEDSEPIVRFLEIENFNESSYHKFQDVRDFFFKKMKILGEIYYHLEQKISHKLQYIDSMSIIRYSDSVCKISPNSYERYLIKYMFENHDFMELVEIYQIAPQVLGLDSDIEIEKKHQESIKNVANEINRRTKTSFGFSIFSLPRGQICLINPEISPSIRKFP